MNLLHLYPDSLGVVPGWCESDFISSLDQAAQSVTSIEEGGSHLAEGNEPQRDGQSKMQSFLKHC